MDTVKETYKPKTKNVEKLQLFLNKIENEFKLYTHKSGHVRGGKLRD
jgi:hypothetical protein